MDLKRINVTSEGTLRTCVYPSDKAFKKGSATQPRSELRYLSDVKSFGKIFNFEVEIKSFPNGTDFSLWQVFGNKSPLLMIRHRGGVKQMVVFDGTPKIQTLRDFPKACQVDCIKKRVSCGSYVSEGKLKCDELYFKVGLYHQGKEKIKDILCSEYGAVNIFKL